MSARSTVLSALFVVAGTCLAHTGCAKSYASGTAAPYDYDAGGPSREESAQAYGGDWSDGDSGYADYEAAPAEIRGDYLSPTSASLEAAPSPEPLAGGSYAVAESTFSYKERSKKSGMLGGRSRDKSDEGTYNTRNQSAESPDSSGMATESPPPPPRQAPGATPVEPEDRLVAAQTNEEAPDDQDTGRFVVYTAQLLIAVYDPQAAVTAAERLPEELGGFVQERSDDAVIMRIPAARLDEALQRLSELGRVDARSLQADDVTEEFVDLQSRIRILKATQAHLRLLLAQAKTVEAALAVRAALDSVTMELEVVLARARFLGDLIAFSTITVQFSEIDPAQARRKTFDPFPWVDSLGVEATEFRR